MNERTVCTESNVVEMKRKVFDLHDREVTAVITMANLSKEQRNQIEEAAENFCNLARDVMNGQPSSPKQTEPVL